MPRITHDPNLEARPDFNSAAYDAVCTALATAEHITKEAVATRLSDAWDADHNVRKAAWEEQLREDEAAEADARLAREADQQRELEELRKEEEAERKEKEKKRPKVKDFVANRPVKDTTQLRPSRFAVHKLDEREYIELYYFTLEGCTEAVRLDRTIAQDAFTFTKSDDTLLLKPMASHKPSSKVVPDEDLTWRQMSIAKASLLHHMAQTGWPEQHIYALAEFFLNLESHPTRLQTDGTPSFSITRPKSAVSGMRLSRAPATSRRLISASSTTGESKQLGLSYGTPGARKACSGKPVSFRAMCTKLTRHLLLAPAPSNPNSAPYVLAPMRHVAPLPPALHPAPHAPCCSPCATLLPMYPMHHASPHAPRYAICAFVIYLRRGCLLLIYCPHATPRPATCTYLRVLTCTYIYALCIPCPVLPPVFG